MVLHDIDLAILASEESIYLQYQRGIREEFRHLQDEEFLHARRKFLNGTGVKPSYAMKPMSINGKKKPVKISLTN